MLHGKVELTLVLLQDDNKVERTFHPDGLTPNGEMAVPAKGVGRTMTEGILSHHEVMYKLDMLEMERGEPSAPFRCPPIARRSSPPTCSTPPAAEQVPRSLATVASTSRATESISTRP